MSSSREPVSLSTYSKGIETAIKDYLPKISRQEKIDMLANPGHPKLKALEAIVKKLESHDLVLIYQIFSKSEPDMLDLKCAGQAQGYQYCSDLIETALIIMACYHLAQGDMKRALIKSLGAIVLERMNYHYQLLMNGRFSEIFTNMLVNNLVSPFLSVPHSLVKSLANIGQNSFNLLSSNLLFFGRTFGLSKYFVEPNPTMEPLRVLLQDCINREEKEEAPNRPSICVIS